jgi:hypothetical protein
MNNNNLMKKKTKMKKKENLKKKKMKMMMNTRLRIEILFYLQIIYREEKFSVFKKINRNV